MSDRPRLRTDRAGEVLRVTLDRPEIHNAFDDVLISEAIQLFGEQTTFDGIRAVVLAGEGANFCAGADLNWMSRMITWSREENAADSRRLGEMFSLINHCPVPVIGRVQGAAIGGGVGLVSVCDIVIATSSARFGLSEVKLGILPAVISPYVIAKIGETHARALFFTGERFDADRARTIGLVHSVVEDESKLDDGVRRTIDQILGSGPEAVRACKRLVEHVATRSLEEAVPYTIDAIAERRVSEEGQAGMRAFLAKEKAPWTRS